jgi:hypothetical protein
MGAAPVTMIRVAVPYRADGGRRDRLWDWCRPHWERVGEVVEGFQHDDGPFNRAACINRALAGHWDVAVIVDADTVAPVSRVLSALHWHLTPMRLLLPYRQRLLLSEGYTDRLVSGDVENPAASAQAAAVALQHASREPYKAFRSGVVVVHRELWEAVRGYDERFEGWGAEDDAFADACEVLGAGPPARLDGDIWHLWHESAKPDPDDERYQSNLALYGRYRRARKSERAMQALIDERFAL